MGRRGKAEQKAGEKGRKENAQFKQSFPVSKATLQFRREGRVTRTKVVERARHCQGLSVLRSVGLGEVRNEDIIPGWKYVMRGGEREQDEKQH